MVQKQLFRKKNQDMNQKNSIKQLPSVKKAEMLHHNRARSSMGLPLLEIKVRTCLVCGNLFESLGKRNCGCVSLDRTSIQGRDVL